MAAVYPSAAGVPTLSGGYIPQLFATTLLVEFYARTVFGAIFNTDYEGVISKQGDTVTINGLPNITISTHANGQPLVYENPDPPKTSLLIDQGLSYGFALGSVDIKQMSIPALQKWAAHAAERMKIEVDKNVLTYAYGQAHANNTGATAGKESGDINLGSSGAALAVNGANIIDVLVDCGTVLDEQDVPDEGRYVVLPSWAIGKIKKSDLVDASLTGDGTSIVRNGRVGKVDRFEIFGSNSVPKVTDTYTCWHAIFGSRAAGTFASQLIENEVITNPTTFGKLARGLQVFGRKVVKTEALGHLYIRKAAEV